MGRSFVMATILYIEDNPFNRRLTIKMLSMDHHTVIGAATGEVGVELARQKHPDLILLDINLPDIDGIEVLRQIRHDKNLENTPVVALTANAMQGDRETFLALGMNGYLPKPITRVELLNVVNQFCDAVPALD